MVDFLLLMLQLEFSHKDSLQNLLEEVVLGEAVVNEMLIISFMELELEENDRRGSLSLLKIINNFFFFFFFRNNIQYSL